MEINFFKKIKTSVTTCCCVYLSRLVKKEAPLSVRPNWEQLVQIGTDNWPHLHGHALHDGNCSFS